MLRSMVFLGFSGAVCLGGLLAHVQDSFGVIPASRAGSGVQQLALARAAEDCARVCEDAANQSIVLISYADTLRSCLDCSTVCRATATVAGRGGSTIVELALACAAACKDCADQCDRADLDPQLKTVAAACRACEAVCRTIATRQD